jgi:predicted NACHT family NTPase
MCHYLKYDDLVNNTEVEINKIYDFLKIPRFNHNYKSLNQFQINGMSYDDTVVGNRMHTIREEIRKEDNPYRSQLPKSIVECIWTYKILMKILIFGLPGSGKTTFAKKLVENKKIPHFNADDIRKLFEDWDFTEQWS